MRIKANTCGFGVYALKNFQSGEFLIEYIGEVISKAERESREAISENPYVFELTFRPKTYVDARTYGNFSRFINHSCDSNAIADAVVQNQIARIGFFASKDILFGEEITINYNNIRDS